MTLAGKIAVVTGSTSGIGLGIARALAAEGAAILLNGFGDATEIAALRTDLAQRHGVPIRYSDADISVPAQAEALLAQAERELGGVHVLVNNAGVQHVSPIEDFATEQWDRVIGINLSGVFHCMKAAIPRLRRAGWGRIVNIASAHGLVASAHKAAYVAAKHGVVGLTKVAALELAGSGITANAICPGWVETPLVTRQIQARAEREERSVEAVRHDLLAEKQPLVEFTTPEQIGALVVFLCSEAARTITGAPLSIDGGWLAQ